jgi:Asp-tRNA(Asn)/Glu-tRNA(Gln) amidotransferase A subunit family amidase
VDHQESSFATRRDFLLTSGVFAAALAASRAPAVARQEQQGKVPPQKESEREQIAPPSTAPSGVTAQTIAEAEKLIGIEFTLAERDLMLQTIGDQLALIASRRRLPYPSNTLAPALTFDPRLPGVDYAANQDQFLQAVKQIEPSPTSDEDVAFAPVTKLARWLRQKHLTSVRLTDIYLQRLKRIDPKLKCVITLTEELARKQAVMADEEMAAGKFRSPLHGIPWGAKDLLDTQDIPTTWGAEPFRDRVPNSNATVVTKLEEAGAVLVAKLSLGALAYNDIWFGGRTNNPWNLDQGSSGSSAGSAAATVAGLVGFSIGTETYGSITSPCLRCGGTGLRPTFGRVSRNGAMALCWSLDKIGPICRTVEDCALVLAAINGHDACDPSSIDVPFAFDPARPIDQLRLGYSPKWFEDEPAHDLDRHALEVARSIGVELVEVDIPDWPYDALLSILFCEAAAAFEDLTRTNRDDELRWQVKEAWPNTFRQSWFIPGIEVVQADRFRRQCMRMMAERFEKVDALIAPSFAASLCLISNNTGHPSLTLRSGFKPDGTPHAITLIGNMFDEANLCRIGMAMERELGVWDRWPQL